MSHTELPGAIEGARSRRIGVKAAAGVSCLVVLSLSCFVLRAQAIAQDSFRLRHGHPYLLFTKPDIARFKERVATEPATEKLWKSALATADQAAGSSGASARAPMEELCLAYQITGDAKYARRIQQILEQMAQRPDFSDPAMLERDPPWHSALGTGSTVYRFAIGFDSIHDFLPPERRKTLAAALTEKGLNLILEDWMSGSTRIHSLDTMGHNWWSALVFNAGIGSIAVIDEEPEARMWLAKIDEASAEWLTYSGSNETCKL